MIMKLLRYLVLFFLPFLIYGIWIAIARWRSRGHENEPNWNDAPFIWLSIIGLLLVLGSLIFLGISQGEKFGGTYIPPKVIDGEVIPGKIQR